MNNYVINSRPFNAGMIIILSLALMPDLSGSFFYHRAETYILAQVQPQGYAVIIRDDSRPDPMRTTIP